MLRSVAIIVLFCILFAEGTFHKKLEAIMKRFNLSLQNEGYGEGNIDRNMSMMTAKFNIDGEDKTLEVMQNVLLVYTGETHPYWLKTEKVQVVLHYVDGNTPMKVTQLHADGKLSVKYLGGISDEICKVLNCQFEIIQPIGSVMKKELVDVTGWAVLNSIASPHLPGATGLVFTHDSNLRCRLEQP